MNARAQSSLEVLVILAALMIVVVIAITALLQTNNAQTDNLVLTNAKSACSLIDSQTTCTQNNIVDVAPGTNPSCPTDCCWDPSAPAGKQCALNPAAVYSQGA